MTNEADSNQQLLLFFKAVADASRLKIIGLLARQPYTVEQLAVLLDLRPSTISHHLARLSEAGLVSAHVESYYNVYELDTETLDKMSRQLLSQMNVLATHADVDLDAYDRKVVDDYSLPDGHLKTIPAQRKKLEAILRYISQSFEPGLRYTEKEVNDILGRYNDDVATLRRELVGYHLMAREKSMYWRVLPEVGSS
jgi:hypothetical protein